MEPNQLSSSLLSELSSALLCALRERTPLVQCITNTVVQQYTANVLLAAGVSPAMIDHEADAAEFATVSDALLVNFGTPTSHHYLAADAATSTFNQAHKPWVLDPVGIGAAAYRTSRIRRVLDAGPAVIRGNASEIIAIAGETGSARGTDSTDTVDAALTAAAKIAQLGIIAAVSGPSDVIVFTDSDTGTVHTITIAGGSPLMPLVIGTGCSLGALTAAYVSIADETLTEDTRTATVHNVTQRNPADHGDAVLSRPIRYGIATATAHSHFTAAATRAHEKASGPGTFAAAFLDALHAVGPEDFADMDTIWTAGTE